jgi:transposase-like protein
MVAIHISEDRDGKEAIDFFRKSLELAKTKPQVLITDGLWAYAKAYKKVFWVRYKTERPEYIRSLGIRSGATNKVERLHGTLKDKTKPLRGFKKLDSTKTILTGWMTHYNLVRPHLALNKNPPAKITNIPIKNDWKTIIQQATFKFYNSSSES